MIEVLNKSVHPAEETIIADPSEIYPVFFDKKISGLKKSLLSHNRSTGFNYTELLAIDETINNSLYNDFSEDDLLVYNMIDYSENNLAVESFYINHKLQVLKELTHEIITTKGYPAKNSLRRFFDSGYSNQSFEELLDIVSTSFFTMDY